MLISMYEKAVTPYLCHLSVSTVIWIWNAAVYQDTLENWPSELQPFEF